jgi:hypothetical protein
MGRNWSIVDETGRLATGLGNGGYFVHQHHALATVELIGTDLQMIAGMPFARTSRYHGGYHGYVRLPAGVHKRIEGNSLEDFLYRFWASATR